MSRVPLTPYLTRVIMGNVTEIVTKSKGVQPAYPQTAPMGVGDGLFAMLLPPEHEKTIVSLAPDWVFPRTSAMSMSIITETNSAELRYRIPHVHAPYQDAHIAIPSRATIRNIPGIEEARWGNDHMALLLAKDGTVILDPVVRTFIDDLAATLKVYYNTQQEVLKASKDMEKFLAQHNTLNGAAKAFGPAFWEYVPSEYKAACLRPVQKRAPRAKKDTTPIDVEYLVACAAEHRLQL